jgi:hypothetical protein
MEDVEETEAQRRHTVSANPKGEKQRPFKNTPITPRGESNGATAATGLKGSRICSNDLEKIKECDEEASGMRNRGVTWSESSARK